MPRERSRSLTPKIRRAKLGDAKDIAFIYNQGISERIATFETEPRSEEDRRKWLRAHGEKYPVLVAEIEDRVAGWAGVSSYRDRSCYSGVGEFSIYVSRDFRGRGIGKILLDSLIAEASGRGYWKLVSRIFVSNTASRRLCESCGFREVGIYEKHGKLDGKWIDTVIVERLIHENLI
jgi:L-amino acid N-acyltransferase YncA